MRIVLAPDKFRGTASARSVTTALAAGIRRAAPAAEVAECPLADGGEGTLDALLGARGGTVVEHRVTDPLGRAVDAHVARLEGGTLAVEAASASGLALLRPEERDALKATSFGTGELLTVVATEPGTRRIVVGVGGTASTDGGTGAARAAGWRFLDDGGRALPSGGAPLRRLARIEPPTDGLPFDEVEVVAACDVSSPMTGPEGAARVFAPQKGASPAETDILEEGLLRLAHRIEKDVGIDIAQRAHGGAGGGLGAGLHVFFGASLVPGFDLIAREAGLEDVLKDADLVITGEGRLDEQSLVGKCTGGVARTAARMEVPCVAIVGELALPVDAVRSAGFTRVVALVDVYGRADAVARIDEVLAGTAAAVVRDWST